MPAEDKADVRPHYTPVDETADVEPEGERKVRNITRGGRYGQAPPDQPHHAPEVPPAAGTDAPARLPKSEAGALPENRSESPDETDLQEHD